VDTTKLPSAIKGILERRRRARVTFMLSKVALSERPNVIDIGCGISGRSFEDYVPEDWRILGVDVVPEHRVQHTHPGFTYRREDAQHLECFGDREFDLAVSVGMLEHITEEPTFSRIVAQIRRVARQYIVVVPYKYCWIEPHYGFPFFPLLPYSMQVALVRALNLCGHRQEVRTDYNYIRKNTRWLSNAEYRKWFPDAKIHLLPSLETIAIVRALH
jgi:hypothetical protein